MKTRPHGARIALAAAAALTAAAAPGRAPAADAARPPARLRDTGLYASWTARAVSPRALPFVPQYPLWSDGASKRRWIRLPAGASIDASDPGAWVFPVGTRLWKEFSFGRVVETRYMERLRDGSWLYATYVWSEDGADAVLAPERGVAAAGPELEPGVRHAVPGTGDCRACHEGKETPVLGFDALQLSPDRDPLAPHAEPAAPDAIDLRALVARGLVRGLPPAATAPRIEAATPTARAALGYLHANCGGCHNATGPLAPLGMALAHPMATGTVVGAPARFRLAAAPGDGEAVAPTRRLVAGHPEASLLPLRMRSRHPLVQMPPLGTRLVDGDAVALIDRWITELDPTVPTNPQESTP